MDNNRKGVLVVGVLGLFALAGYAFTRKVKAAPPPPPECEGDRDCPPGYECIDGICVPIVVPPECTDGPPYCVINDLYQCINGKVVLIEKDSLECGYVPPPPPPEGYYIDGLVYESGYGGIEGVLVSANYSAFETYTDENGNYILDDLPPGYFNLAFTHPLYHPQYLLTTLNNIHPHRTKNVGLWRK